MRIRNVNNRKDKNRNIYIIATCKILTFLLVSVAVYIGKNLTCSQTRKHLSSRYREYSDDFVKYVFYFTSEVDNMSGEATNEI